MAAERIIYSRLTTGATADITTDVSPRLLDPTRNSAQPYVVYYRDQTNPNQTKTTTSVIDEETYTLECYATTHHDALSLAEAVRSDLDRAPAVLYGDVQLNGSSFRAQTDADWDDKTQNYCIEVEIVFRISRTGTIGA